MKIALYIEEGLEQIVLTPESDTERSLLAKLQTGRDITIHRNRFYRAQGGFVTQGSHSDSDYSTMIVLTPSDGTSKIKVGS